LFLYIGQVNFSSAGFIVLGSSHDQGRGWFLSGSAKIAFGHQFVEVELEEP
jgi:hypothetical protein